METELRALVKTAFTGPVDWGDVNQGTPFPYAVMTTVSDTEQYHQKGADGLSVARVQIDVYDGTYGKAKTASNAIRNALSGFRGGRFQGIFLDTVRDLSDVEGTDGHYRVSMDYIVNYERS